MNFSKPLSTLLGFLMCVQLLGCSSDQASNTNVESKKELKDMSKLDTATFGAGCFWCVEAIFQRVEGVEKVESGYTGGKTKDPTYQEICSGLTGHAEVIQVYFDPAKVTYAELLEIFWKTHDPTTLNQQGADKGTQYRSAVFYHNEEQMELAEKYKKELDAAGIWDDPIVTEITALSTYYSGEKYHQNYYNDNTNQGYCRFVITPKVEKFEKVFGDKMKEEYK